MKRFFVPLLVFFLLWMSGCGRDSGPQFAMPEFREEVRARAEIIVPINDGPSYLVRNIFSTDSYLIVLRTSTLPGIPFLHVYDKRSRKPVMQTIFKGRGPADLLRVNGIDFNANTGDMLVTDGTGGSRRIAKFNVYDLLADGIPRFEKRSVVNCTEYACLLDEDRILFKNNISEESMFPNVRFEIYDAWDSLLATYTEFPIRDTVTDINFWLHQQARLSLSPDRKRLAVGTLLRGATLECFDIAENDISLRWAKYLIEPAYDRKTGERLDRGHLSGFMDVYAADELIVTVLGDDKQDEVRSICLFDWEGHAVKRIVLEDEELDVFRVCMDSEGNIYALVDTEERVGYLARIVETGPAPDGYRISESKIKRFSPEEDPEPSTFGAGM